MRARPLLFAMDSCVAAVSVALEGGDGEAERAGAAEPDAAHRGDVPCFNPHPHLTLWVARKGLARMSNHLLARVAAPNAGSARLAA